MNKCPICHKPYWGLEYLDGCNHDFRQLIYGAMNLHNDLLKAKKEIDILNQKLSMAEDKNEDLELANNKSFVINMARLIEGIETTDFDIDKVRKDYDNP